MPEGRKLGSSRLRAGTGALALLLTVATAGCSSGSSHLAAPTSTSTSTRPASTVPPTPSSAPASSAPPTTSLVGLVVTGQGSTLVPPAAPTVKPFTTNCGALEDSGYNGPCEIITTPAGSIAAMVEIQQQGYSTNQSPAEERDLVYHRTAAGWSLALRRTETNNAASGTTQRATLWQSDINRDGDAKAVFVTPAPNPQFGEELDVVEATGQVIILRQLHGGFATVLPSGGLETLLPDPAEGYDQAVIKYSGGAWRIASVSHVSQAQAQSQGEQPFTDPQGSEANYSGHA